MENHTRTLTQETAIKATQAVFGTIHLVLDILSTATCMAEANVIKKIDPHTPETIQELMDFRRAKSMATRSDVYAKIQAKRQEIEAKMQAKNNVSSTVVTQ